MKTRYKLCGIQIETGSDPRKNIEKAFSLVDKASRGNPDFMVLPEMFEIVPEPSRAGESAHTLSDELVERLAQAARSHEVNLIGGSIIEKDGDALFNTSLVFDRDGELRGRYRKIHLFDAFDYGESKTLKGGSEPLLCTLDDLPFGLAICYDIRFPEVARFYAAGGAKVVFFPAAFFQPNHDHWDLNIRCRALDNGIFVMGCNQTGKRFVGRSAVSNPWGIPVASMGIEEGFFCAEIDLAVIDATRRRLPLLENRRFDVHPRP